MNTRKLLASTALTTSLLIAGSLPAAAGPTLNLGGYGGGLTFGFKDYESFITPSGAIVSSPTVGDDNFGIFKITSVLSSSNQTLCSPGVNCLGTDELVGVFANIKVTATSAAVVNGQPVTITHNKGGTFQIYAIPNTGANFDQGTTGYSAAGAGCTVNTLCYNGITNAAGAQLLLTMDLNTLTASLDVGEAVATGSANGTGTLNEALSPDYSQFLPTISLTDDFCSNAISSGCTAGSDGSNFAVASKDPIGATAVPEPASLGLLGMALLGFGGFGWFRRRKQTGTAGFAA